MSMKMVMYICMFTCMFVQEYIHRFTHTKYIYVYKNTHINTYDYAIIEHNNTTSCKETKNHSPTSYSFLFIYKPFTILLFLFTYYLFFIIYLLIYFYYLFTYYLFTYYLLFIIIIYFLFTYYCLFLFFSLSFVTRSRFNKTKFFRLMTPPIENCGDALQNFHVAKCL